MKNISILFIILFLIFSGCSKEDTPAGNNSGTAVEGALIASTSSSVYLLSGGKANLNYNVQNNSNTPALLNSCDSLLICTIQKQNGSAWDYYRRTREICSNLTTSLIGITKNMSDTVSISQLGVYRLKIDYKWLNSSNTASVFTSAFTVIQN